MDFAINFPYFNFNFELGFMSFVVLIIVGKSNTHVMFAEIVETEFVTSGYFSLIYVLFIFSLQFQFKTNVLV